MSEPLLPIARGTPWPCPASDLTGGGWMRWQRTKAQISMGHLARLLKVSVTLVSDVERGKRPFHELLTAVAEANPAAAFEPCGAMNGRRVCVEPHGHGGDWHDDGHACWPT